MSTNTVARAFEQDCFCVPEVSKGKAVYPSAATQRVITAGTVDVNQQANFSDSEEIIKSLDLIERFQDQTGAGSWSVPMYLRPSGVAGTAPMGNVLIKSLMGDETVNSTTSVSYTQALTKPSFTLWVKKAHTVFFAAGCCAESGKLNFTNKGGSHFDMSGGFMQMGWAGTDTLASAASTTAVTVTNAKLFTAGAYVSFGSGASVDHNANAGYKIVSVDYDTNILTMAESITQASGTSIQGFLPTYTAVGTVLENKNVAITFDGTPKKLKSLSVDINSPVAWQTEEITTSGFVSEYIEDRRSIKLSLDVLFREQDLSYFYDATQNTKVGVIAVNSGGAGNICTINLPYCELEVPNVTTSAPTVSLSIAGTALGSSGEDSCSIVFT
ncbi:MAG: hypothetical protein RBR45_14090 [Pseudomonas sp.]|nr:hypothetical protein [Pseudomonas sp.]